MAVPNNFTNGTVADAEKVDENFADLDERVGTLEAAASGELVSVTLESPFTTFAGGEPGLWVTGKTAFVFGNAVYGGATDYSTDTIFEWPEGVSVPDEIMPQYSHYRFLVMVVPSGANFFAPVQVTATGLALSGDFEIEADASIVLGGSFPIA